MYVLLIITKEINIQVTMDEQYIIAKVQSLMPDEHHIPQGVLYSKLKTEIQKDVSKALNNLLKQKEITFQKTLNDLLINIKE